MQHLSTLQFFEFIDLFLNINHFLTYIYYQQDFGFCWGVERSIALAYEAVDHFPNRNIHITNELIHNPEVNQNLSNMKVKFIEKAEGNKKRFDTIEDGDVVILPAFGASLEEMDFFDKMVSRNNYSYSKYTKSIYTAKYHCIYTLLNSVAVQLSLRMERTWKSSIQPAHGFQRFGTQWTSINKKGLLPLFMVNMDTRKPLPLLPFVTTIFALRTTKKQKWSWTIF